MKYLVLVFIAIGAYLATTSSTLPVDTEPLPIYSIRQWYGNKLDALENSLAEFQLAGEQESTTRRVGEVLSSSTGGLQVHRVFC